MLIAGMVGLGLSGDYVYFGVMRQTLSVYQALIASPVAGVVGGVAGGISLSLRQVIARAATLGVHRKFRQRRGLIVPAADAQSAG